MRLRVSSTSGNEAEAPSLSLALFLRWDYTFFDDPREPNQYAQWRGWTRVLAALRSRFPAVVMDHRQRAHLYGPWASLAGSYAEPIAGDENPETYGIPIASLHADHVGADNARRVNYVCVSGAGAGAGGRRRARAGGGCGARARARADSQNRSRI